MKWTSNYVLLALTTEKTINPKGTEEEQQYWTGDREINLAFSNAFLNYSMLFLNVCAYTLIVQSHYPIDKTDLVFGF